MLVAGAALLAPELDAQRRAAPGGGLWFAGGLGGGWAHVSCAICRGRYDPGTSVFVRLGGTAGRRLLIGAEAAVWVRGGSEVNQDAWALSAAAYWYPGRRGHLYLKGGIGYATHHAEDGTDIISSSGFGPQLGVGYEFPLGRRWRIAPHFNAIVGAIGGGVKFNGSTAQETANVSLIQFGLSLIHP
jgi:hypothetical protein